MAVNGSPPGHAAKVATPQGTAIDVHTHAMPLPLLQQLAQAGLADLAGLAHSEVRLDPRISGLPPRTTLPLARSQFDVDVRLSEMDGAVVRIQAVSLSPFLLCATAEDAAFTTAIVEQGNDELATYVADASDRLLGLGSVPLGWPSAAEEARRALDHLDMAGIAIGSQGGGRDLDDPVNDDLWALLSERHAFVFLHPTGVPGPHRQANYWLPHLIGYPMETALAAARLVFGRVLERFPLTICLAHGGGCLPALRGRLDTGWERIDAARTTAVPPSAFTDRLYYDTAVFSPILLRRLIEDVGVDHVLLGTDHPFQLGDRAPLDTVRALGLNPADTQRILWRNAAGLLGLDRVAPLLQPAEGHSLLGGFPDTSP